MSVDRGRRTKKKKDDDDDDEGINRKFKRVPNEQKTREKKEKKKKFCLLKFEVNSTSW